MRFRHAALRSPLSAPLHDLRRQARLALSAFFALTLTLSMAGPLWADSVSNLSLTPNEGISISETYPSGQGFTTGTNSNGYTLQSITLKLKADSGTNTLPDVTLLSSVNGVPGTVLTSLSPPVDVLRQTWRDQVFTCTAKCDLTTSTPYFVVVTPDRSNTLYWAQNSSGTDTNTPDDGWSIADLAKYRDGSGGPWKDDTAVKLMTVSYKAKPDPDLWVENITMGTARLWLRNWSGGAWSWKVTGGGDSTCHSSRAPAHTPIQDLSLRRSNTSYTVTAHSGTDCASANLLDTETFTTRAADWKRPALSVSNLGTTSATLSIANHTGDWWYVATADTSTCTRVDAGGSASLSSLTANTSYKYVAYSAAGCEDAAAPLAWITDPVSFATLGPVTATVTIQTSTSATLTVSGISSGNWSFEHVHGNPYPKYSECTTHDHTTNSVSVTGLTSGAEYVFYVYRGESCTFNEWITATATTISLTSGQVGSSSATLKLEHYEGEWSYQGGQGAGQAQAGRVTGTVASVSGDGVGPASAASQSTDQCQDMPAGQYTANLTGLTPDTEYTWKAYEGPGCKDAEIASTTFTTATAGTHPPTGEEPDQAEAEAAADLQPTFGAYTIGNQSYEPHQAIGTLSLPAATSGNGPLTYALTPALPAGLRFDAATRTLSGTPTGARPATTYTYTATDADVSEPDVARLTFTIEVVLSAAEQAILEDGLAAQGRALLSGATGVIGERFRTPGASSVAETGVAACLGDAGPRAEDAEPEPECATGLLTTVAQAMLGISGAGGRADPWGLADADDSRLRGPGLGNGGAQPAWDWESLIWGRSFALPLNAQGAPGSAWTLWGAGDIQGFEGSPRQGTYDGQVRSLYLGVDAQWQAHWLAGAALAQSWGETDYVAEPGGRAGQVETTLTSVYPYVRGTLGSGLEVWAIGGYGRGEAEQTQAGVAGAGDTRDLTMAMGATGVRQPMTEVGGAQVALVGGAGYLSLATEEGPAAIADLDVAVNRARLAVEAAWTAGGLATHAADGYAEYGGLARLAVKPQADGTGFRMTVAPRWGAADGGAGLLGGGAALLDGGAMPGLGVNGLPSATTRALMLESELGYGVAVFEGHGVLTPYGGFAFTGNETRQYRLGARLGMAQWLNLSLEGARRDATGPQPADQGVQLQLQGRF